MSTKDTARLIEENHAQCICIYTSNKDQFYKFTKRTKPKRGILIFIQKHPELFFQISLQRNSL